MNTFPRPAVRPVLCAIVLACTALALTACEGTINQNASSTSSEPPEAASADPKNQDPGKSADPADPVIPEEPIVIEPDPVPVTARTPARRLSDEELDQTIEDLFSLNFNGRKDPSEFLPSGQIDGFENDINGLSVSSPVLSGLLRMVEYVTLHISREDGKFVNAALGCNLTPKVDEVRTLDESCIEDFIARTAPRAYRRPVSTEERAELRQIFDLALAEGFAPKVSAMLVIERMLLSIPFLYRIEYGNGETVESDDQRVYLSSHEMASKLSYLLWGTLPDDELMELAAQGKLSTPDEVESQARRMMRTPEGAPDPRAVRAVRKLYRQWLGIDDLRNHPKKNPPKNNIYNSWKNLRPKLLDETSLFFDEILWGGTMSDLLTADYTYLNEGLAELYDVEGVEGEAFRKVQLDTTKRQGFLTQGAVIARSTEYTSVSPIFRGAYVLRRIMCDPLADPPPNVVDQLPEEIEEDSYRSRYDALAATPGCDTCHNAMHGIGFGFMHYDSLGRWRAKDPKGDPVDASGEVLALGEGEIYEGAPQLGGLLADSGLVQKCLVRNLYRFAHGRADTELDAAHVQALVDESESNGGRFEDTVIALVRSDVFRSRAKPY